MSLTVEDALNYALVLSAQTGSPLPIAEVDVQLVDDEPLAIVLLEGGYELAVWRKPSGDVYGEW